MSLESKLHKAISQHKWELVRSLSAHPGVDVNKRAADDIYTPLGLAVYGAGADETSVEILLSHPRIDINATSGTWGTPLAIACYFGYIPTIIRLMASEKVEVNPRDSKGRTPFFRACERGQWQAVQLLLKYQAVDVTQVDNMGVSPVRVASDHGHLRVVQLILASGRNLDLDLDQGMSVLVQQGLKAAVTGEVHAPGRIPAAGKAIATLLLDYKKDPEGTKKILREAILARERLNLFLVPFFELTFFFFFFFLV